MPRRVEAVVLNYRQPGATLRAAAELSGSRGVEVDVLVVDAASPPEELERLRRHIPADRLLALPDNRGYAGGMNAGLAFWREHGTGAPVLLLTPDARIGPDVARALAEVLESDPGVAAAGPVVVFREAPYSRIGAGGTIDPERPRVRLIRSLPGPEPYDTEWIEGCCMLLRPGPVAEVGGFDEAYFLYFEEIDLCQRLRDAGWRLRVVPSASVLHPKEAGGQPAHTFYYMTRNGLRFWKERFGVGALAASRETVRATLWTAAVALGSLLLPPRWGEARGRLRDAWLQAAGALAGTRDHLRGRYGPRPAPRRGRASG